LRAGLSATQLLEGVGYIFRPFHIRTKVDLSQCPTCTMSDVIKPPAGTKPRDYRDTLFLPKTEFPMRAGLPARAGHPGGVGDG